MTREEKYLLQKREYQKQWRNKPGNQQKQREYSKRWYYKKGKLSQIREKCLEKELCEIKRYKPTTEDELREARQSQKISKNLLDNFGFTGPAEVQAVYKMAIEKKHSKSHTI